MRRFIQLNQIYVQVGIIIISNCNMGMSSFQLSYIITHNSNTDDIGIIWLLIYGA